MTSGALESGLRVTEKTKEVDAATFMVSISRYHAIGQGVGREEAQMLGPKNEIRDTTQFATGSLTRTVAIDLLAVARIGACLARRMSASARGLERLSKAGIPPRPRERVFNRVTATV